MLTWVFDASTAIRFIDNEAGSDRVRELLRLAKNRQGRIVISAVNWGEVVSILDRRKNQSPSVAAAWDTLRLAVQVVDATANRAAHAGVLQNKYGISYADAFGVELATDSPDHVLVTADYGVKPAANNIVIEFLPLKPKP